MATATTDIVQKLWNLCTLLREDGVTYHQYVTELTYLLFLKMMKEQGRETALPKEYRWGELTKLEGVEQLDFYKRLLLELGKAKNHLVRDIYENASTTLKKPKTLAALVQAFDQLEWFSGERENLGDLYEGLLEKNANEVKSGAGQYFTPRPLVRAMVECLKPRPGELIQDPAAGTGGFLIEADRYIKEQTDKLFDLPAAKQEFQKKQAFFGMELVEETRRLALMNLLLHDIEGDLRAGDTLSPLGAQLAKADVILTNPPFGTKAGGGKPSRDDFTFPTSNKQLAFVEHVYRALKPGGRAAVVVPDNVLFEDNVGREIRTDLMDKCDLHTVLRLPTGIFYAQGVKTNVLFFTRGTTDKGNTKATWFFDLRANMPSFGKKTPLTAEHFAEFLKAYGEDPNGKSKRKDQGEEGRFRKFTREAVKERNDNLDLSWLKDESHTDAEDLPEPEVVLAQIREKLEGALAAVAALEEAL
ncbi:MAG: N-6 DNA methylase [Myxococcota bacterium]